MSNMLKKSVLLAVLSTLLAACAAPQQVTAVKRSFYWPQLPERPRVQWIESFSGQKDFPKTDFQIFTESIAGAADGATLLKPVTIASNGEGKVYVVDNDRGALGVHVIDFNKMTMNLLGKENSFGLFEFPIGIDLDASGNIYVADINKDSVLIFDNNEKPGRAISTKQDIEKIGGIAIDRKRQRIVITDFTGHKLVIYDLDGKRLVSTGKRGVENGEFNFPTGVAVNHKGEIIVADSMNARVQVFDGEGVFSRKFGRRGDAPGDLQVLKGLAVDSDDNIYVTDSRGHKFVIFNSQGDYLLTIGGLYSALGTGREAPGGFVIPQGIAIDKQDRIYVVDQMNKRFQIFQYISDAYLKANPITGYTQ